jgi:hypothetical protein
VATPVRAGFASYSGQLAPLPLAVPTGLAVTAGLAVLAGLAVPLVPEQAAAASAAAARAVPPAIDLPRRRAPGTRPRPALVNAGLINASYTPQSVVV